MSKRRWLMPLLLVQTVVIVLLAWMAVYLGRDEWRLSRPGQAGQDDEGGAAAKGADPGGYTVKLSQRAQRMAGISIGTPEPGQWRTAPEIDLITEPAPNLAEPRQRLLQARQEAATAGQRAQASRHEAARQQALYDDEHSTSQRALEQARQQAEADELASQHAQRQQQQVQGELLAIWGPVLGTALLQEGGSASGISVVDRLQSGQAVLLRPRPVADPGLARLDRWPTRLDATLPLPITSPLEHLLGSASTGEAVADAGREPGAAPTRPERFAAATTDPRPALRCAARSLQTPGPASLRTDGGAAGPAAPLYLCDPGMAGDGGLLPGSRLVAAWPGSPSAFTQKPSSMNAGAGGAQAGVWLPAAAVVWQGGLPWVYLRTDSGRMAEKDDDEPPAEAEGAASAPPGQSKPADKQSARPRRPDPGPIATFERRPLRGATRVGERWFVPGLGLDDPVVVRGAQLLLSEEHKFQIRNENDD